MVLIPAIASMAGRLPGKDMINRTIGSGLRSSRQSKLASQNQTKGKSGGKEVLSSNTAASTSMQSGKPTFNNAGKETNQAQAGQNGINQRNSTQVSKESGRSIQMPGNTQTQFQKTASPNSQGGETRFPDRRPSQSSKRNGEHSYRSQTSKKHVPVRQLNKGARHEL